MPTTTKDFFTQHFETHHFYDPQDFKLRDPTDPKDQNFHFRARTNFTFADFLPAPQKLRDSTDPSDHNFTPLTAWTTHTDTDCLSETQNTNLRDH